MPWNGWQIQLGIIEGNVALGRREITHWPILVNLRVDPYEQMPHELDIYVRWCADNLWLIVPA